MRHQKGFNHLSRKANHRKAMLSNMANSLIMHKRIKTTTAKARALRMYIEPIITKSKEDNTHSRRVVFSYLKDKYAVSELFREVSPKVLNRPGGYTRILKTGTRAGDNADMCIIELVDYNENLLKVKEEETKTSTRRRSRRGGKKKASGENETKDIAQDNETVNPGAGDVSSDEQKPEESAQVVQGDHDEEKIIEDSAKKEEAAGADEKKSSDQDGEEKDESGNDDTDKNEPDKKDN